MSNVFSNTDWPQRFSGRVRVLPLPHTVLFPHITVALHLFEPPARSLLQESLADDRLIALVNAPLTPSGRQEEAGGLASVACVGKIASYAEVDPGRFNVLLYGLKRVRLITPHRNDQGYWTADVQLLEDRYSAEGEASRSALHRRLQELFELYAPAGFLDQEMFQQFGWEDACLGTLTDIIAYTLDIPLAIKQQLLAECDVDVRGRIVLRCLQQACERRSAGDRSAIPGFPSPFSDN
ncbi:MAG: ATP-dependent protease [Pirellulaceae bacterium]|nr:MAG: ATP-dependent protease [Pirellulaceae bacterium]